MAKHMDISITREDEIFSRFFSIGEKNLQKPPKDESTLWKDPSFDSERKLLVKQGIPQLQVRRAKLLSSEHQDYELIELIDAIISAKLHGSNDMTSFIKEVRYYANKGDLDLGLSEVMKNFRNRIIFIKAMGNNGIVKIVEDIPEKEIKNLFRNAIDENKRLILENPLAVFSKIDMDGDDY